MRHKLFHTLFFFYLGLLGPLNPTFAQSCELALTINIKEKGGNEFIPGAIAWVKELDKGFVANNLGVVKITGLCAATPYQVEIHSMGYQNMVLNISLSRSETRTIHLDRDLKELKEVIIAGELDQSPTQASEKLSGIALSRTRGKNLGESLSGLPGLNTLQTGPGISKPIIHGLYGNRILILNNGIRQEGQQWGAEHAPEIDPFVASKITVIKGAEGVRYGPDALGGVIILEPESLSSSTDGVSGQINMAGMSNSRMGVLSGIVNGNAAKLGNMGWRLQTTGKKGGDFNTAQYNLMNTGLEEFNFSAAAGWETEDRGLDLFISRFDTRVGILRSAHIGNLSDLERAVESERPFYMRDFSYKIDHPQQRFNHTLLKLNSYKKAGDKGFIHLKYGGQWNSRQEFDVRRGGRSDRAALDMDLNTHSLDLSFKRTPKNNHVGEIGVTGMYQQNRNIPGTGVSPLIPYYNQLTLGAFWIEKYVKEKWQAEFGLRYDYRHLEVKTFSSRQTLVNPNFNFQNYSFSIGGQWNPQPNLNIFSHFGSAWRPPHVSELFSNGLHHGVAAIERGLFYSTGNLSDDLESEEIKTENSFKWLTGAEFKKGPFAANLNVFYQRINNYIYLKPMVGEFLLTFRGAFPLHQYVQADVQMLGTDGRISYNMGDSWTASGSFSIIRARDLSNDDYLVLIPPDQFQFLLRRQFQTQSKWIMPFIEAGMSYVRRQDRVPFESDFALPPDAFALLQMSVGSGFDLSGKTMNIFLDVENLANTSYRNYLNRMRYFADDMGRNISVRLQYNF